MPPLPVRPRGIVVFSEHSKRRAAQRNVSIDEVFYLLHYARPLHRAGVIFWQLHARALPADLSPNHPFRRLAGTTVVTCTRAETVITIYRNDAAFRRDRCKPRFRSRG